MEVVGRTDVDEVDRRIGDESPPIRNGGLRPNGSGEFLGRLKRKVGDHRDLGIEGDIGKQQARAAETIHVRTGNKPRPDDTDAKACQDFPPPD